MILRALALGAVILLLLRPDARANAPGDYECSLPAALPSPEAPLAPGDPLAVAGCAIDLAWRGGRVVALHVQGVPDAVAAVVCDSLKAAMLGDKITNVMDQRWANTLCKQTQALQVFEKFELTGVAAQSDEATADADKLKVSLQLTLTMQPQIVAVALDPLGDRDPVLTPLLEAHGAWYEASRIESMRNAAQNILIGNGFAAATLTVASTRTAAGVQLRLTLKRGKRATLTRIIVEGNHLISQAEVERLLALDFPAFNRLGGAPSVALVQGYAAPRVMRYLRKRGYLAGEIREVTLQQVPGGAVGNMQLAIKIFEGAPFILRSVVDKDPSSHPARLAMPSGLGELVDPALYERLVDSYSRAATLAGFSAAIYVDLDPVESKVDISYRLTPHRKPK